MQRILSVLVALAFVSAGFAIAGDEKSTGACWMTNAKEPYKGFVRGWALVSAEELNNLIEMQEAWNDRDTIENSADAPKQDPKLVIIDVGKPVEHYRAEGHVPGAYNIWRPDYESDEKLFGVRGENLMSRKDFQNFLRGFGIDNDSMVVFYDHKYDATRLWWSCKYYGFDVRVLDGGFKAWKSADYEVDRISAPSKAEPGNLVLTGGYPQLRVGDDAIWKCKKDPMWDLWDIRSNAELDGSRNRAKRMGGIAWTKKMLPWKKVHGEDGTFLDAKGMQKYIDDGGYDRTHHSVFICQSGVRTTQALFALYLMGWPIEHLHNYDNSWIYWGNAPDTPIVDPDGKPVPYPEE